MKNLKPLLFSLVFLVFLSGCGANSIELFLQKEVEGYRMVWRRGSDVLTVADHYELKLNKQYLVMVSVRFSNSKFAEELKRDSRTRQFIQASDGRSGYALMGFSSLAEVDAMAALAHINNPGACGNIELLDPSRTLTSVPETLTPPIYREDIKLATVGAILSDVSKAKLTETIRVLEAIPTRYHSSATGLTTPDVIQDMFEDVDDHGGAGFTYNEINHSTTSQKSLVVRLPGSVDPDTTVVIGAHMDSIQSNTTGNAPGADDDASGIAVLVEIVRILAAKGFQFHRSIELHAYAAEEVGLRGSMEIATDYQDSGRKIAAMMQLDMTAYSKSSKSDTIYIVSTDTTINLNRSLKDLLHTYLGGDFIEKPLSAGTSDHKSWSKAGFPAAFPFEDPENYNEALHTADDTLETINNLDLTKRFTQLALTFLAHHAGLIQAESDYTDGLASLDLEDDLALAILPTLESDDLFHLAVGTTKDVEKLETCRIPAKNAAGCSDLKQALDLLGKKKSRNIFYQEIEASLDDGQYLRVFGYDKDEKLAFQRDVILNKK